ncbi:flagellar motor protein MotB [Virgibacillus byunsanensis]|uniref:Flagellar motor protein MotB n=1 Tax=Virgibacillus byunsanensis TaxID=570945 RepID=A0ABW3LF88_9BACI
MRKKKQRKDSHIDETWLLPYSDMLTLLVALFIILFAMSEIDTQKYKELTRVFNNEFSGGDGILEEGLNPVESPDDVIVELEEGENEEDEEITDGEKELIKLEDLQSQINDYISENNLSEVLGTKLTGEGLFITIMNDISFDSGSAIVKQEGIQIAKEISNFLYTDPANEIVISGHTDDVPIRNDEFSSNWELSVMRAVNFMSLILDNDDLDPRDFGAKGFGEYNPVVPNNNEENRAINRRVEVLVLPNYDIKPSDENRE